MCAAVYFKYQIATVNKEYYELIDKHAHGVETYEITYTYYLKATLKSMQQKIRIYFVTLSSCTLSMFSLFLTAILTYTKHRSC